MLFGSKKHRLSRDEWYHGCNNLLQYWLRSDAATTSDIDFPWEEWYKAGDDCPTAVHSALDDDRCLPLGDEEYL